ncbi:MAG: tetratricopeptide repeat protein [Bdellovibrionota bacterium]
MNVLTNCPRCQSDLGPESFKTGSAICKCGWYDKGVDGSEQKRTEKNTVAVLAFATLVMALGYGHLINWGSYAVAIPFVKVQQMTGTLSSEGYIQLAEHCVTLNKWKCAENAYVDLYKSKGDLEALAKLGSLEARLEKYDAALQFYSIYAEKGGRDNRALLNYGTLLENAGRTEDAFKTFELAISTHPDVLPVQATTAIVRMLMKQGKTAEAKERIVAFHKSAGNAKGYLNTELTQLSTKNKRPNS